MVLNSLLLTIGVSSASAQKMISFQTTLIPSPQETYPSSSNNTKATKTFGEANQPISLELTLSMLCLGRMKEIYSFGILSQGQPLTRSHKRNNWLPALQYVSVLSICSQVFTSSQGHPYDTVLATAGLDTEVNLWSPCGNSELTSEEIDLNARVTFSWNNPI